MASTPIATVLNSTLTRSRKKLILASIKSNALMAWAFANNRVEFEDGGHEITNPLTLGRNPNITSYEYFDEQPIAQTSEFDTVTYNWARVGGSVVISDQEEDENQGAAQIFKLMKAKIDVLEESLGCKAERIMEPMQPGDVKETYADISESEEKLGFKPKISIDEGISKFIKWYKSYYK